MPDARAMLILLVLAGAALAGCTAPPAAPAEDPAPALAATDAPPALPLARARTPAAPVLPLSVSVDVPWLKPFRTFEAVASTSADAEVVWFIQHEDGDARATVVDGEVFVLRSTTPDHHDTQGPRSRADVLGLAPDGRARALRVDHAGRYTLAVGGAQLAINAWPDAPRGGPTQAFLVADGDAMRFDPPEIDVPSGARVLLWNHAGSTVDVREASFAGHVPLAGARGEVTPIDEGLYTILALARDRAGARGVAGAGFLVDFERPSERIAIGPLRGEFTYPESGAGRPVRSAFTAHFPMSRLSLRFNASSPLPAPASVEVSLWREGTLVTSASSLTARTLEVTEAPAGDWAIEVRGEHGALVAFELTGEGLYRLPVPARLRESTE